MSPSQDETIPSSFKSANAKHVVVLYLVIIPEELIDNPFKLYLSIKRFKAL